MGVKILAIFADALRVYLNCHPSLRPFLPTERKVLNALIEGKSLKDISRARKTAIQTVWRHRASIFRKIGVESQVELVRVATQWQI